MSHIVGVCLASLHVLLSSGQAEWRFRPSELAALCAAQRMIFDGDGDGAEISVSTGSTSTAGFFGRGGGNRGGNRDSADGSGDTPAEGATRGEGGDVSGRDQEGSGKGLADDGGNAAGIEGVVAGGGHEALNDAVVEAVVGQERGGEGGREGEEDGGEWHGREKKCRDDDNEDSAEKIDLASAVMDVESLVNCGLRGDDPTDTFLGLSHGAEAADAEISDQPILEVS